MSSRPPLYQVGMSSLHTSEGKISTSWLWWCQWLTPTLRIIPCWLRCISSLPWANEATKTCLGDDQTPKITILSRAIFRKETGTIWDHHGSQVSEFAVSSDPDEEDVQVFWMLMFTRGQKFWFPSMHVPLRHKHILLPYYGTMVRADLSQSKHEYKKSRPSCAFVGGHSFFGLPWLYPSSNHGVAVVSQHWLATSRYIQLWSGRCWCWGVLRILWKVCPARGNRSRLVGHDDIFGTWADCVSSLKTNGFSQRRRNDGCCFASASDGYPLTIGDWYCRKDHNQHKHSVVMLHYFFKTFFFAIRKRVSCA